MKLTAGRVGAFLANPGATRIVLIHGDDEGLVRNRADALTRAVVGAADDPFRVSWLSDGEHDRLVEEATSIAMMGGRRVVRVRGAGDPVLPHVERVARTAGDTLVVLESEALPKRSKLLSFVEAGAECAAIACYPETPQELRGRIAQRLEAAGVRADPDALDWLRDRLGADTASTDGEIEKLVLFAAGGGRLDLDDARSCVGDQGASSMDDAVYAATLGDVPSADRAIERALAEGTSAVAMLRMMLGQLVRLHQARGRMEQGGSAEMAVKAMRPPIFFKREKDMIQAVRTWTLPRVAATMAELRRAELACKQTGAPDLLIARRFFSTVARQSARR